MSDATRLARGYTEAAVKTIVEVMEDPLSEDRDRLRAAETILDRGHGKAAQAVIQIPADRQLAAQLAALSDAELMAVVNESRLPRLTVDAEFTEVISAIDPLLL